MIFKQNIILTKRLNIEKIEFLSFNFEIKRNQIIIISKSL